MDIQLSFISVCLSGLVYAGFLFHELFFAVVLLDMHGSFLPPSDLCSVPAFNLLNFY